MIRIVPALLAVAVAVLLATAASAAPPSPRTMPGWPKALPPGWVMQGPGGGVVHVAPEGEGFGARAFRRDGRRLWHVQHDNGCGNCDWGPQEPIRQPDGTFGPIGPPRAWAVDAAGRPASPCSGVGYADGACVTATSRDPGVAGVQPSPGFAGRAAGPSATTVTWFAEVPGYAWDAMVEGASATRDDRGVVYAVFPGALRLEGTQRQTQGILAAIDPASSRILWVVEGPRALGPGLRSGVLVRHGNAFVAHRSDGTVAWGRPVPAGRSPGDAHRDAVRGALYLGSQDARRRAVDVTAVREADGTALWRTRPADRAGVEALGRGGRVYLSAARARTTLRAVRFRNGRTVWEKRGRLAVSAVQELVNGTVAVSLGEPYRGGPARLTLLDPR